MFKRPPNSLFLSLTGIAPITVVTHCDQLRSEEEREEALEAAYKATNSSPSHTFLTWNYTKNNSTERNLEIERMIFDILHYALITAERAVKQMKHRERKERDDKMRALRGMSVSGQVAPDSPDGNVSVPIYKKEN